MDLSMLQNEMNMNTAIPRPIPTMGMPKMPTTISATTTSSSNSNTKLTSRPVKTASIGPSSPRSNTSSPDPNKPIINPVTNRKSYDHINDRELRKKLKNRESAQAARDRKKAKMLALERQLSDMAERNKILENENRELRGRLQRIEADAFWRLVKNPAEGIYPNPDPPFIFFVLIGLFKTRILIGCNKIFDLGGMEGNPMAAAMMNQGMHPNQAAQMQAAVQAQAAQAAHVNMMQQQQAQQAQQQQAQAAAAAAAAEHPELMAMQAEQQAAVHKQLYQRQMQFLLEGAANPAAAAAAFHSQMANQSAASGQSGGANQTVLPPIREATLSPIESLGSINYNALRSITKGEPIDDDPLPDLPSPSPDSRHPSGESSGGPAGDLDDWILRNFKGENSPLSAMTSSPTSKGSSAGSTGYSSAGCESPEGNQSPSSPSPTIQENIKSLESLPISWNQAADRLQSSDSAFSESNFGPVKFFPKNEKP